MAAKTKKASTSKSGSTASARKSKKSSSKREMRDVATPAVGGFAVVTKSGDDQNKYGVVEEVLSTDKDGDPDKVVFRTRDDKSERLVVKFSDLEHAEAGRR